MQYSNAMSWFNSPSLPSPSTFDQYHLNLSLFSSPPVPHRRAPAPPSFFPRRRRARHMRLAEPATKGLFTLQEVDEDLGDMGYKCGGYASSSNDGYSIETRILSARASSELLCPSPERTHGCLDLPEDVDGGELEGSVYVPNRLSWVSASTSTGESTSDVSLSPLPTPTREMEDDPFFVDVPLDIDDADIDITYDTFISTLSPVTSTTKPRRPPPLDLSGLHPYAYSAEINRWSTDVDIATPRSLHHPQGSPVVLLPALPIYSKVEYEIKRELTRPRTPPTPHAEFIPRKSRRKSQSAPPLSTLPRKSQEDPFDLVAALEDLLASGGEPDASTSSWSDSSEDEDVFTRKLPVPKSKITPKSFPLPPPRTPTLSPASASSTSSYELPITPRTPRHHQSLPPLPSRIRGIESKRQPIKANLMGNHSFLFSMSCSDPSSSLDISVLEGRSESRGSSRSKASEGGSAGSGSVSGRLPQRSKLPIEWTRV